MPTLAYLRGIKVIMYYEDHDPPHFHARGAEFRAKFAIGDLSVLALQGRLKPRESALIRQWALANRDALLQNWLRARHGEPMAEIEGVN